VKNTCGGGIKNGNTNIIGFSTLIALESLEGRRLKGTGVDSKTDSDNAG